MALKRKLTKVEFDALGADLKKEYKAEGDAYVLDVEGGIEDPAELRRAKDREKLRADEAEAARKKAEDDLAEANRKLNDGDLNDKRKKGDIEAIETSWKGKVQEAEEKGNKAVEKLRSAYSKRLVDDVASTMAAAISESPAVLIPHIKSRLQANFDGEEPATRVLDKDGKPTALTVEDLQKEIVANPDFAGIITGSKASGAGGTGGKQGGAGGAKKLQEMSGAERVAFREKDPAGYKKAVEEQKPSGPKL